MLGRLLFAQDLRMEHGLEPCISTILFKRIHKRISEGKRLFFSRALTWL